MIDLTVRQEDKDYFITKVYVDEDNTYFKVCYASGREEKHEFSVHNLNAYFYMMEEQFRKYRNEYVKRVQDEKYRAMVGKLVEVVMAVLAIVFVSTLPIPNIIGIILDMIIVIVTLYYQNEQRIKERVCDSSLSVILTAEEFLKNKEQFMTKVENPVTHEEEDWYLVSLSGIEEFLVPQHLKVIGSVLTEEAKMEEASHVNKVLRKIYEKKEGN